MLFTLFLLVASPAHAGVADPCDGQEDYTSCGGSDVCYEDVCISGNCVPVPRNDDLPCGSVTACSEEVCQGGECVQRNRPDETSCGPSDTCYRNECVGGTCEQVNSINGTPCGGYDVCFEDVCMEGACTRETGPYDGRQCGPGYACIDEICQSGFCSFNPKPDNTTCGAGDTCFNEECLGGQCREVPANENTPCGPGDVCNEALCREGFCQAVPVADDTPCGPAGLCNEEVCLSGTCFDRNINEGQSCGPGDVCNDDLCIGGACRTTPVVDGTPCGPGSECKNEECVAGSCSLVNAEEGTLCGDGTTTPCTLPDSCNAGMCAPNHVACGYVTSSSLCAFDVNPDKGVCVGGEWDGEACLVGDPDDPCVTASEPGICAQSREFRLLFTPDGQLWPAHKLNGSNPGQYYYNAIYDGTPGADVTLSFTLPYPFVTQGAMPARVYDAAVVDTVDGCFNPDESLALAAGDTQITIEDWISGSNGCTLECGPIDGTPTGTCSFDLPFTVPPSGQAYVSLHLDYGLKGPHLDANPCDDATEDRYDPGQEDLVFGGWDALLNNDAGDGPIRIVNCAAYDFAHTDGFDTFGDTVSSINEFKRIEGVFGQVKSSADDSGLPGVAIGLVRQDTGKLVQSSTTDEDGYYTVAYRHQGKPALYTLYVLMELPEGELELQHELKLATKGWAEVTFDAYTGSSVAEYGNNSGAGSSCNLGQRGDQCLSGGDCCSGKCNTRAHECR